MERNKRRQAKKEYFRDLLTNMLYFWNLNDIVTNLNDQKFNRYFSETLNEECEISQEEKIAIFKLGYLLQQSIQTETQSKNEKIFAFIKEEGNLDEDKIYLLVKYIINNFSKYDKISREAILGWIEKIDTHDKIKKNNKKAKIIPYNFAPDTPNDDGAR